jgi:hypothetical protein
MNLKLNLGCGLEKLDGFVNIDKYANLNPDQVVDLEVFPYPFKDNSVGEILLIHVLEHLGQTPEVFINIMKELYRICAHEATLRIIVPHWRHDDFFGDPTHVRAVTPMTLALFDLERNKLWARGGFANNKLAMIHGVNFKTMQADAEVEDVYLNQVKNNQMTYKELERKMYHENNVVKQMSYVLKAIKQPGGT